MKKNLLFIILILFGINKLTSQNYQTFYSDRISFFDNNIQYDRPLSILCVRIDSVKKSEDSIFYPNPIILLYNDCFSPKKASWIGEKIIIQSDYNIFFNLEKDSIKIKTTAKLYDSWISYRINDSTSILASVTEHDTSSFLGIKDSVKTISFQAIDKDSNFINHSINLKTIQISRNYGIIKTFSFFRFPNFLMTYYNEYDTIYNLIGLSNPNAGIINLTKKEVFNFSIGDEIHEEYRYICAGMDPNCDYITKKTIRKYLQSELKGDSIIYKIDIQQSILRESLDGDSYNYYHDTIVFFVTNDSIFDKLPGEPRYQDDMAYTYNMYVDENGRRSKVSNDGIEWILNYGDNECWTTFPCDYCYPAQEYIEGIGGPYYCVPGGWGFDEYYNSLVYYKKGEYEWGNPLILTNNIDMIIQSTIISYPNPCSDFLFFRTSITYLPYLLEIYDISGKMIFKSSLLEELVSINISKFSKGLYFYKIIDHNNSITTGKFVKK